MKLEEIEKVSSDELLAISDRLERIVAVKRAIEELEPEAGAGMVMLSGRELELIAYALRRQAEGAQSPDPSSRKP